jgi:hypothetical protein
MANTVIQLKYSDVTGTPPLLNIAEPAYSNVSNKLWINDGSGVVAIGGKYYTQLIDAATSNDTANTLVRRDTEGNFSANTITANSAIINGYDIYVLANNAFTAANNAFESGGVVAGGYANSAYEQANTATQYATSAGSYANSAYSQANTATTNAATADQKAVSAGVYANSAYIHANSAYVSQNTTGVYANAAYAHANTKLSSSGGTLSGDLNISGNLTVLGNVSTHSSNDLIVNDPIILLANNNAGNIIDLGFTAHYVESGNTLHTGLIKHVASDIYYLFDGYIPHVQETNILDINDSSFKLATLSANIISDVVTIRGYDPINHANNAYNQANTGTQYATSAGSYANSAYNQANTGTQYATSAGVYANSAYAQANSAQAHAGAGYNQANTATTNAATADQKAVSAGSYANSAYLQANTGTQYATSAGSYANSAYNQANTAQTHANAGYNQANTATTNAATADQKAVSAGSYANSAYNQANTATTNAATAQTHANAGYNQANVATQYAQSAGSYANSAYALANTKFSSSGGTISGNVNITGDLFVGGNTVSVNTETIDVQDSLIKLANNNLSDVLDIGFYGQYNDGVTKFSGLIRDASDGIFRLFKDETEDPSGNVVSYGVENRATLDANFTGGNVSGLFNAISVSDGGLGVKTLATNAVLLGNGTNPILTVGSTTEGHILTISASGAPTFQHLNGGTF